MTPARRSPSTRTLGSQLVVMSTVLALIDRMFLTASSPMPVIATSRKATTAMILVRIEYCASMTGISWFWAWQHADYDKAVNWENRERCPDGIQTRIVLRLC